MPPSERHASSCDWALCGRSPPCSTPAVKTDFNCRSRPIADIRSFKIPTFQFPRSGPWCTAQHLCSNERALCGQSRLLLAQLLLTQHFLAVAAGFMLRCSLLHGSGHSMLSISVDFKPSFRRIMFKFTHRGLSGLARVQLVLTQKILAHAPSKFWRCRKSPRTGHETR